MTGAVTGEMVLFFLAILSAVAGVWWRIEGKIDKAMKTVSDEANTRANGAHSTATLVSSQLAEFKLEAARTYVSYLYECYERRL